MGMAWGVQHKKLGEEKGRICWGKPCFSGFFSYSSNCSDAPEGEKMRGLAGALPGGAHKKGAQETNSWTPFAGAI